MQYRNELKNGDIDACFPPKLDYQRINELKLQFINFAKKKSLEKPCFCCGQLNPHMKLSFKSIKDSDFASFIRPLEAPDYTASSILCSLQIFKNRNGTIPANYFNMIDRIYCEPRALHTDGMISFCHLCYQTLNKNEIPKFALKQNLWTGEVPDELLGLSLIERLLISKIRLVCYVQTVRHGFKKATGSLSVFIQNTKAIYQLLPHALNTIDDMIRVCFDKTLTDADLIPVKRMFLVRKNIVLSALEWLKHNNPFYSDIEINTETDLPENSCLSDKYFTTVDINTNMFGPANLDQTVDALTRTGFIDLAGNFRAVEDDIDSALHNLQSLMIVPGESMPIFAIHNVMELSYPHLFPFGCGGFAQMKRTFPEQIKALLNQAHRRFSYDESFLFAAFNYYCRKKVSNTAKYKYTSSHYANENLELLALSPEHFEQLIKNPRSVDNSAALTLLKRLQIMTISLPGSAQNKSDLRKSLRWLTVVRGGPGHR